MAADPKRTICLLVPTADNWKHALAVRLGLFVLVGQIVERRCCGTTVYHLVGSSSEGEIIGFEFETEHLADVFLAGMRANMEETWYSIRDLSVVCRPLIMPYEAAIMFTD